MWILIDLKQKSLRLSYNEVLTVFDEHREVLIIGQLKEIAISSIIDQPFPSFSKKKSD